MNYVEDFLGLGTVIMSSQVTQGTFYATAKENINPYKRIRVFSDYESMLEEVDAVYIHSYPDRHYQLIKTAIIKGKHVLCEAPITINKEQYTDLQKRAREAGCILMDSIRTAFSTAYERLLLLLKSGMIGDIKHIDATCTSLKNFDESENNWNSICAWGPNAMLPVFQILGTHYRTRHMVCKVSDNDEFYDYFTKIDFIYNNAVASIKVGQGVKSEGEMIVSGTKGYVYVPAPWWKTDYFEVRFENQENNRRYFYQLEGEGIRYELVAFRNNILSNKKYNYIDPSISLEFISVIQDFYDKKDVLYID